MAVFEGIATPSDSSEETWSDSSADVEDENAHEAVVRGQEERIEMAQDEPRVRRAPGGRMQPNVPLDQDGDSTESADDEDSDSSDADDENSENGDSDSEFENDDVEMEEADDEESSIQETIEMIVQELIDDEMEDSSSEETSGEYSPDEGNDDFEMWICP